MNSVTINNPGPDDPPKEAAAAAAETAAEPTPEANERDAAKAELDKLAKAAGAKWREKEKLHTERQRLSHEAMRGRAELEAARKELAFARTNPLDFVEKHGVPAGEIAQRIIKRGSFEGTVEELRAEIAALKQRDEERTRALAEGSFAESKSAAEESLLNSVRAAEADYPALSVLPQAELLYKAHALAEEIVAKASERGSSVKVTPDYLLTELEKREAPRFAAYQERAAKRAAAATEGNAGTPATKAEPSSGQRGDRASAPRTLSNSQASERGSKPVDFDRLPEKEQNKRLAAMLREGRTVP